MLTEVQRQAEADHLYEKYGKPLEADNWGEYVAISPEGKTVLASSLLEVLRAAKAALGLGNYVFRVGERGAGGWRRRPASGAAASSISP